MKKSKKFTKGKIIAIIVALVIALVSSALIVLNAFVPVKYLSAYVTYAEAKEEGEAQVAVLDVGYGDCIVAELPNGKTLLIDGGDGSYSNNLNILKYLNSRGITKIDYLICSSVKSEHCGGLTEIIKYKQVEKAYIPYCKNSRITQEFYNFYTALNKAGISYEYSGFGAGDADEDYNCFFTFLSPSDYTNPNSEYSAMNSDNSKDNVNNASAVVWLKCGKTNFAFCSDAGTDALKNITDSYNLCKLIEQPFLTIGNFSVNLEDCNILTVAGHGSDKNTYAEWYDLLSPERAIVSVGKNYYDCPSVAALANVTNCGAQVLLTSDSGNIKIQIPNN
jgi:competence protein ComEC